MTMTVFTGAPWKEQYLFNTTASSTISSWNSGGTFPASCDVSSLPSAFFIKSKLYVIGWYDTNVSNYQAYVADVDSGGVLGNFSATSIVPPNRGMSFFTTGSLIYCLGGTSSSGSVRYATVNQTTGEISSFSGFGPSLPSNTNGCGVAVTSNKVYVFGGSSGSYATTDYNTSYLSNAVYSATIQQSGLLSPWVLESSFYVPEILAWPTVVVAGPTSSRRIYLFGGIRPDYDTTISHYVISVDSSGNLSGEWAAPAYSPSIAANTLLDSAGSVVWSGGMFLIGGRTRTFSGSYSTDRSTAVYYAPLNASGEISSAWTSATALPEARTHLSAVATSSRLYVIGECSVAGDSRNTRYATFAGGLNNYLGNINSGSPDTTSWILGA